jgi:hypothetical protein
MPSITKSEPFWPFVATAVAVAAVVAGYAVTLFEVLPDWTQRGQFGDMFGGLNTAFSGLAFAALAYTLNLQRKELALQRQELAETRAELAKQAQAQEQQAKTALRAAEISALGALFQSYSQLVAAQRPSFIAENGWPSEIQRVRDRLVHLLRDAERDDKSPTSDA